MAHAGLFEGSPRPSSDSPNPLKDKQPGSNAHRGSTSTISTTKGTAWNRARALRASYKDFAKDRKETQKERRKKQIQNLTFCWAIRRCCSQEPPRAPLRAPSACYGQSISVLLLSFVSQRANPGAKPTSLAAGLSVKKHRLALFFFFSFLLAVPFNTEWAPKPPVPELSIQLIATSSQSRDHFWHFQQKFPISFSLNLSNAISTSEVKSSKRKQRKKDLHCLSNTAAYGSSTTTE